MAAAEGTVLLTPGRAGGRLGLTSLLCCRDRLGSGADIWGRRGCEAWGEGFALAEREGDESREEKGEGDAVEGELETLRERWWSEEDEDFVAAAAAVAAALSKADVANGDGSRLDEEGGGGGMLSREPTPSSLSESVILEEWAWGRGWLSASQGSRGSEE